MAAFHEGVGGLAEVLEAYNTLKSDAETGRSYQWLRTVGETAQGMSQVPV